MFHDVFTIITGTDVKKTTVVDDTCGLISFFSECIMPICILSNFLNPESREWYPEFKELISEFKEWISESKGWNPKSREWNPEFKECNSESRVWNLEFREWNPESREWNPKFKDWNSESREWNPESREWNNESKEWNPESKNLLDYFRWLEPGGAQTILLPLYSLFFAMEIVSISNAVNKRPRK